MTRLHTLFARPSHGVKSLSALCLLAAIGAGAWALAHPGGTDAPAAHASQATRPPAAASGRNLALQPAARAAGRRLGRRFLSPGLEVTLLEGTLTTGSESRRLQLRRVRGGEGERVEVVLAGAGSPLTWDARRGALSAGRPAAAAERALVERLALDSPDQFVLAQTRGASYQEVARQARADEGGAEGYSGALYEVVRVGEPERGDGGGPASAWRLYYVNSATGLPERVVSEEGGEKVEAVLSGWVERAGEVEPMRVTWTRRGAALMELVVTNFSHGSGQ